VPYQVDEDASASEEGEHLKGYENRSDFAMKKRRKRRRRDH